MDYILDDSLTRLVFVSILVSIFISFVSITMGQIISCCCPPSDDAAADADVPYGDAGGAGAGGVNGGGGGYSERTPLLRAQMESDNYAANSFTDTYNSEGAQQVTVLK